jgi:hypothetical protein
VRLASTASLTVLLGFVILFTLFGSLDVFCWDVHSFYLSPPNTQKNTLVWALALPETLAVNTPILLRELLTIRKYRE